MSHARVSRATTDAKGREGASRPRDIRSGKGGKSRPDATQSLEPLRQAVLMPLVNRDRQRWFRQLTGLRLTVVWHVDPGRPSPGVPPIPCPRAHRLLAASRSLPDACRWCAGGRRALWPDAWSHGFHFACALGLTTFVLSPEVVGTHPVSLVLQVPGSFATASLPRRFAGAVELVRLIAHDLTLAARTEAAKPPYHGLGPHAFADAAGPASVHPLVVQMLDFARQHYHLPIHLDDVAAALGRNSCYLCNLFSRTVGKTFHHHLDDLRLSRARELLRDRGQSVCDVAYAVGYTDANYFRQAFKAHIGCAPSAWRQGPPGAPTSPARCP